MCVCNDFRSRCAGCRLPVAVGNDDYGVGVTNAIRMTTKLPSSSGDDIIEQRRSIDLMNLVILANGDEMMGEANSSLILVIYIAASVGIKNVAALLCHLIIVGVVSGVAICLVIAIIVAVVVVVICAPNTKWKMK
uniref:Transmembrane protein n=1 Tax=Glossina pallidipes TaxID=7398 RepID=A0A1A9ZQ46_GLOPL